jgi:hypothetical protein
MDGPQSRRRQHSHVRADRRRPHQGVLHQAGGFSRSRPGQGPGIGNLSGGRARGGRGGHPAPDRGKPDRHRRDQGDHVFGLGRDRRRNRGSRIPRGPGPRAAGHQERGGPDRHLSRRCGETGHREAGEPGRGHLRSGLWGGSGQSPAGAGRGDPGRTSGPGRHHPGRSQRSPPLRDFHRDPRGKPAALRPHPGRGSAADTTCLPRSARGDDQDRGRGDPAAHEGAPVFRPGICGHRRGHEPTWSHGSTGSRPPW